VRTAAPQARAEFVGSGFRLLISSTDPEEAFVIATHVNIVVLRVLFGNRSLSEDQMPSLFRATEAAGKVNRTSEFDIRASPASQGADRGALHTAKQPRSMGDSSSARQIEIQLAPVYDLRRSAAHAVFCVPTTAIAGTPTFLGPCDIEQLSPSECLDIDARTLACARVTSRKLSAAGATTLVGASVNFMSLAWTRGRRCVHEALRNAETATNPNFALKIDDVPNGVRESRLAEIVSVMRPLVRHIFVHLRDGDDCPVFANGVGASAFVSSLPIKASLPAVAAMARTLVHMSQSQRALACIDRVDSNEALQIVSQAGIRLAMGRALGPQAWSPYSFLESPQTGPFRTSLA
jgi:hypothetical protein